MEETNLELTQRLVAEGKSNEAIHDILLQGVTEPQPVENLNTTSEAGASVPSPTAPVPSPSTDAAVSSAAGVPADVPPAVALPQFPPLLAVAADTPMSRLTGLGWPLIIILCLIPTFILLLDIPITARFGTLPLALLTLGDMTGIIGLGMYVANLVLATRWQIIETMFGGLNRVFIAHAVLGSLALMMLLVHPIFSAFSYYPYGLKTVAHFFVPQVAYIGSAFGILALIIIIVLVFISLFLKLGYNIWLKTHKYLGIAYLLIGLHVVLTPNKITADPIILAYLWLLLIIGGISYLYRTLLPNIFVRRYLYTIKDAQPKGIGTVEVTLAPVDKAISFKAGQFVFIAFDNDALSTEWHPFSVTSAETSADLKIDLKSLGGYTETMTRLLPRMVGMTVHVEGAYGRFSYQNVNNVNQIWVAGGIGITPFLSMAQALGTGPYNIDLYYSVKTQSELIDLEVLAARQSSKPGQIFRVFPFITDTYNTFLSAKIIAHNSGNLEDRDVLLCGPPMMMHAIGDQLITLGVSKHHIHSEEFSLN
jgi:predicted ferric reductase